MDPHPIVVHFPIALLTLYTVFEFIRFRKVVEQVWWFYLKAVFVILGAASALLAFLTGPEVSSSRLVEMHERFAIFSLLTFGLIALIYLTEWARTTETSKFILKPYIIIPLALLGLVLIIITGGLGGAIVYGTHFDPFMSPIFKLLKVY